MANEPVPLLGISQKQLSRILFALVVILAFTAGYFHARLTTQERYNGMLKKQVATLHERLQIATASAELTGPPEKE